MNAVKLVVVAGIILILSQLNQWEILDKVFFTVIGVILVAWLWSWFSLRDVTVTRETKADRAQVGQSFMERIRIVNAGRLSKLWVEIIDQSDMPGHKVSRVVHLGPNDSQRWRAETTCGRRGRFRIGPLVLRSGDPFGLFPRFHVVPDTDDLLVYPATVDMSAFALPVGDLPGGSAIQKRTPFVTPNASSVRDYFPGDAFNRIAWRASARTNKLMVKEFELDPTADIWIVLDMQAAVQAGATGSAALPNFKGDDVPLSFWLDSTEEYGVTIAASLARHFLQQNRNVGLISSSAHTTVMPADRGGRQMFKILEQLAVVRADGTTPFGELLLAESGLFNRNSTLIVITSSTNEEWAHSLIEIVSRGVQSVAVIVEPSTFGSGDSALFVVSDLASMGIPTYLVKYGDDISRALASYSASAPAAHRP
ncbi:MAG: DUF58 domain-containing protein [Chloroflexia bacterium]|nr:DUF58 domain-containing protein [Chloroflexia bacterium]